MTSPSSTVEKKAVLLVQNRGRTTVPLSAYVDTHVATFQYPETKKICDRDGEKEERERERSAPAASAAPRALPPAATSPLSLRIYLSETLRALETSRPGRAATRFPGRAGAVT
jgi:hypothetical protein